MVFLFFFQILGICKALAIPAGPGDRFGDWPLYIRASYCYHGRPWYSDVALQMEAEGQPIETWYGQVRLFIRHGDLCLALVRIYIELFPDHWDTLTGSIQLSWTLPANLTRAQAKRMKRPEYIVVDVANILRAIHVVPHSGHPGRYFLNRWKF